MKTWPWGGNGESLNKTLECDFHCIPYLCMIHCQVWISPYNPHTFHQHYTSCSRPYILQNNSVHLLYASLPQAISRLIRGKNYMEVLFIILWKHNVSFNLEEFLSTFVAYLDNSSPNSSLNLKTISKLLSHLHFCDLRGQNSGNNIKSSHFTFMIVAFDLQLKMQN